MEDPSDRLRRDQDKQNRQRENDRYDRRHFAKSLASQARISDLNDRIEAAERRKRSDEALEAMSAGWPEARAAIEQCAVVTPDIRTSWLKRFDAIRYSGKPSATSLLVELERDVNAVAATVSGIAADLQKAVEPHGSSLLARILPKVTLSPRSTVVPKFILDSEAAPVRPARRRGVLPPQDWPDALVPSPRADDLQLIHDQIMRTFTLPLERRIGWITRMDAIDKHDTRAGGPSMGEQIEALVGDIHALATVIRSVGIALGYQASQCRRFWGR